MYLQLSPLYPLKGRIASNISHNKFGTITPLRGQGVKNTTLSHFTECN
jgi:hypothetical protein